MTLGTQLDSILPCARWYETLRTPRVQKFLNPSLAPKPQTPGCMLPHRSNFYLWPIFAQTNGPALWQSSWQNFIVYLRGTLHMNIPPRKEDGSFTYLRVQRKLWLLLGVNSLSHLKKK